MRVRIDVRADARDGAAKDFVRVSGGHRFELLSDMHARQFVFVNVSR